MEFGLKKLIEKLIDDKIKKIQPARNCFLGKSEHDIITHNTDNFIIKNGEKIYAQEGDIAGYVDGGINKLFIFERPVPEVDAAWTVYMG